ncbi:sensor domain-containing protein [Halofilum ochraceum]|uniref:sensor domain-containing protein n=1 Tax=Halofilum ochraceum TaxID=1611323 RepID=UPI0015866575|nr:EAL domain-containing protein [Halofilum ochraceum]
MHADGTLSDTSPRWPMAEAGMHLAELIAEADRAAVESALRAAITGGDAEARAHLRDHPVELIWRFSRIDATRASLSVIPPPPPPATAAAVADAVDAGIALSDRDGRLRYVNEAYARIYGRPRGTLLGRIFADVLQPEDRERALAHHRDVLASGPGPAPEPIEYEIQRSDGVWRIVDTRETLLELPDGPHRLATVVDVTGQRANERHLADTEARLRDLMDTIPGAIYQFRHTADGAYVIDHLSEGLREITGFDGDVDMRDFDAWRHWTPPEALGPFLESIEASRHRLTPWSHEWPIDVPAGRVWLYGASRPHRRPDGETVWNGLLFDITSRKIAEQRLGQAETDYRHVFEHTREGIYRSTPEGRLLDVNWPLVRMHRCESKQELIDRVQDIATDWYVDPEARARIRRVLGQQDHVEDFQAQAYRVGTGERFWTSENGRAVRDADGTVLYYQGTVRDITDQRRAARFATRRGEILEMVARGEPLTRIVYEIVGTLEEYQPRLTAAVCQLHDGVMDVEAAPALSNECIAAIHDVAPSEIGGAIAAAMRGPDARLDSEQGTMPGASERLHEAMATAGYADIMAFPVLDQEGAVLGVLIVFVATREDIDDSVRNLLHEMSQITSIAFEQHQLMRKLVEQAQYDPLTQLPNRSLLGDRLRQTMLDAGRKGHFVAVILLDLDEFKLVNDTLGHNAGDQLLTEVAARLQDCLRAADTVARFGGDEFVAVVPITHAEDATEVAERILNQLQPRFRISDREIAARPSIGISLFPQDGLTADNLIQAADTAMYTAKHAGKNQYRYFAESMNDQVAERLQIEAQLRDALEHGQLILHYQPRVQLPDGDYYGAEALLRWEHPERGLLQPGEFLPIAEQSALIGDIDRYVLAHGIRQVAQWQAAGHDIVVSMNLSARLLNGEGFGADVARLIHEAGARPTGIELEITESMVMQDFAHATRQLRDLRERCPGLRVALDDFGAGYSSLQYLRELPIDTLKIDRSFVADLDTCDVADTGRAIAKTIVELGQNLGMHVIAEGVETPTQVEVLLSIDCHEAQGFWFARPMPADAFAAALDRDPAPDPVE